ncbi:MAG: formyltetrahydrofolate deformylase [Planctomycetota bacterium]|nr:formyltetrahydrofolate deformylase [Planctomycetota bacterium]
MKDRRFILTVSCPDRVGIVAAVSGFLASCNGWILEASHHADWDSKWFFMRHEILASSLGFDVEELRRRFAKVADQFGMSWKISDTAEKKRVAVLVSKEDHCLSDLLYRWRSGELDVELAGVVSNHPTLGDFTRAYGVPYHVSPVAPATREQDFARLEKLLADLRVDTVVLARYMQILPPNLCTQYAGRVINIHHSFLPSFAGAKPYHQAFERGVKLIGATCHYVTPDLDAGPIIEQDVIRVNHGETIDDMIRLGRDVEKTVLSRGLRYHVQDRVLVHRNKTVVFE